MTSKLYIASKPATLESFDPQHLYLVYDPDGVVNSGDELIIRGGPPAGTTGVSGFINIEIAVSIIESLDGADTVPDLPSSHILQVSR